MGLKQFYWSLSSFWRWMMWFILFVIIAIVGNYIFGGVDLSNKDELQFFVLNVILVGFFLSLAVFFAYGRETSRYRKK
jgi:hypothetical protein